MNGAVLRGATVVIGALVSVACGPEIAPARACLLSEVPMPVADVLADPEDPCRSWVERVYGRAVRVFPESSPWRGSGTLWTTATAAGTAVLVTAGYVLSPCYTTWDETPGAAGTCAASVYDPADAPAEVAAQLATAPKGVVASTWSPVFAFMHPQIQADELADERVPSSRLFSVWAVDDQELAVFTGQPRPVPASIQMAAPEFPDPEGLANMTPTWADVSAGSRVLVVGFPETASVVLGTDVRTMHVVVTEVLDDAAAGDVLMELAAFGDLEGALPYEPEAEMLLAGDVAPGMGGAGVFDEDGRLVGIVVRHAQTPGAPTVVRAVRMSHVAAQLRSAVAARPDLEQAVVPFLPRDLVPP